MVGQKLLKYDISHNCVFLHTIYLWPNRKIKSTYKKVGTTFPRTKINILYLILSILRYIFVSELTNVKKRVLSSPTLYYIQLKHCSLSQPRWNGRAACKWAGFWSCSSDLTICHKNVLKSVGNAGHIKNIYFGPRKWCPYFFIRTVLC